MQIEEVQSFLSGSIVSHALHFNMPMIACGFVPYFFYFTALILTNLSYTAKPPKFFLRQYFRLYSICNFVFVYSFSNTCILYIYIHVYIHAYIRTYVRACVYTYVRMCVHTYIHSRIHTYIHIRNGQL